MKDGNVTVIITVWKRDYLDQQLQSLIEQSFPPSCIWIIHNERHISIQSVVDEWRGVFPQIYIIHSDFNFRYFGRFAVCSQVTTAYTLIIDDDVIPGRDWLKICVDRCSRLGAIVSCTGRLIRPGSFRPEEWSGDERKTYFIGDNFSDEERNYVPEDTTVDYGCNSYFFKTEWIRHFWAVWPRTFQSGEDIHLSGSLMISQSIPTVVPEQRCNDTCGNLKKYYSQDEFSSWKDPAFIDIRETVFNYLINEKNWRPLLWE
nr:glycosyltransferase [uncultured Chitinophaga sp.]